MKCINPWLMAIFNFPINLASGRKNSRARWITIKKSWGHQLKKKYNNSIEWRVNFNKFWHPLWSKKLTLTLAILNSSEPNSKNWNQKLTQKVIISSRLDTKGLLTPIMCQGGLFSYTYSLLSLVLVVALSIICSTRCLEVHDLS